MLVVANHTAGIDPILIQAACGFEVSWMMAADMMVPQAGAVWRWTRVIRVERTGEDGERRGNAASLREAVRRLQAGGVVGLFPEGRIERPRGVLLPFMPGVGLLVVMADKRLSSTGAPPSPVPQSKGVPILPVVIEGTPDASTAWGSLWRRSRSTLRVLPMVRYERTATAEEITSDLEERFMGARHLGGRACTPLRERSSEMTGGA